MTNYRNNSENLELYLIPICHKTVRMMGGQRNFFETTVSSDVNGQLYYRNRLLCNWNLCGCANIIGTGRLAFIPGRTNS